MQLARRTRVALVAIRKVQSGALLTDIERQKNIFKKQSTKNKIRSRNLYGSESSDPKCESHIRIRKLF